MKYLLSVLIIFISFSLYAQNETEIKADGIIFPRLNMYQIAVLSAVKGQVVYNTSTNQLNAYNGSNWTIVDANIWSINGDEISYGGNVGVGISNPSTKMHVFNEDNNNLVRLDGGLSSPGRDLLEIKVAAGTPGNGQFIEMENGSNVVAKVNTDGSAKFESVEYNDGSKAMGVYAFATINADGTIWPGGNSNNFTCSWNATENNYELTLNNATYHPSDFFIDVMVYGSTPRMVSTSSLGGVLDIYLFNYLGQRKQAIFSFVIYSRQ